MTMAIQALVSRRSGAAMPTANMATTMTTATTNSETPLRLNLLRAQPKAMATNVKRIEMVPVEAAA